MDLNKLLGLVALASAAYGLPGLLGTGAAADGSVGGALPLNLASTGGAGPAAVAGSAGVRNSIASAMGPTAGSAVPTSQDVLGKLATGVGMANSLGQILGPPPQTPLTQAPVYPTDNVARQMLMAIARAQQREV